MRRLLCAGGAGIHGQCAVELCQAEFTPLQPRQGLGRTWLSVCRAKDGSLILSKAILRRCGMQPPVRLVRTLPDESLRPRPGTRVLGLRLLRRRQHSDGRHSLTIKPHNMARVQWTKQCGTCTSALRLHVEVHACRESRRGLARAAPLHTHSEERLR